MFRREWLYLIAALAALPLMVTGDSLWMDEGGTALYAMQPDFPSWYAKLNQDTGGNCQMPLGMFCAWVGGKVLGVTEWQLRAINIVWGALTLFIMARVGRRLQLSWLPLLFALQPFFWFYTNEARPYAAQITFGALLLLSFVQFLQARGQGRLWALTFTAASVLLCLSSMISPAMIVVTVVVAGVIATRSGWKIERSSLLIMIAGAALVAPMGYYYLETLIRGAKGVVIWKVDLRYIAYIAYEISGALGLGPSVVHIRELALAGRAKMSGDMLVHCGLAFSLIAVVAVIFSLAIRNQKKDLNAYFFPVALIFLLELLVLFTAGMAVHKAFWPRHYSPAFPCYVTALGIALGPLLNSRKRFDQALSLLFLGLLIAALVGIRFGAEHRKEDYRWASQQAVQFAHAGNDVWWCADSDSAIYYGITFETRPPGQGAIFLLLNRQWDGKFPLTGPEAESFAPNEILISRPDVSDGNGAVRKLIHEKSYHLVESRGSFELWSK